jgi:pseudouridine synthase
MDLIEAGKVKINSKRRRSNRDIIPNRDTIEVEINNIWTVLEPQLDRNVIAMYKPRGYLCTTSDPHSRPIIYHLLPEKFYSLRSAGRLDQDSEGLLILTDDGYFLFKLISPKFPCFKTYLVGLESKFEDEFIKQAGSGTFTIERNGEIQTLRPVDVTLADQKILTEFEFLNLDKNLIWYQFILTEGKHQQIRKMSLKFENEVKRLIRVGHSEFRLSKKIKEKIWLQIESQV